MHSAYDFSRESDLLSLLVREGEKQTKSKHGTSTVGTG
jgi:hypothetical protein